MKTTNTKEKIKETESSPVKVSESLFTTAWKWFLVLIRVLLPMEGRQTPRINTNNPLTYLFLLLTLVVVWLVDIVKSIVGVICGGLVNVLILYISTIRNGIEDDKTARLTEQMKEAVKRTGNYKVPGMKINGHKNYDYE